MSRKAKAVRARFPGAVWGWHESPTGERVHGWAQYYGGGTACFLGETSEAVLNPPRLLGRWVKAGADASVDAVALTKAQADARALGWL